MLTRVTVAQSPTSDESVIKYASILPTPDLQSARTISNNAFRQPRPSTKNTTVKTKPIPRPPQQGGWDYSGRTYSKEEVIQIIKDYSAQYGISADVPLRVANCESGYNQFSRNRNSTATGVFQYLASTWKNTEAGKQGISVFDADANVHMAIKSIASGGINNWAASKSCWNV